YVSAMAPCSLSRLYHTLFWTMLTPDRFTIVSPQCTSNKSNLSPLALQTVVTHRAKLSVPRFVLDPLNPARSRSTIDAIHGAHLVQYFHLHSQTHHYF